ncbi:hypothetical protein ABZ848_07260 [Streptomyces sp. NPDC047081]|uniref:hypothetical protein n=1 Tax=Streptomyces sp. NPDC047081 TaxID=3154706 RepID=UPI0033C99A45
MPRPLTEMAEYDRLTEQLSSMTTRLADSAQASESNRDRSVNTALREVLENRRRALALTRLRATAEEGAFDFDFFEDKDAEPCAPVDDRAYDRAWRDLVVAATAELQGLTPLHRDRDFECIAAVTGQALQWYGPEAGK